MANDKLPSNEPPTGRPPTDRELLALPDRGPPREGFGDRYFYPMIALVGLAFLLVPRVLELPIRANKFGVIAVLLGLGGWARERWWR
jgi:hypothetical protein